MLNRQNNKKMFAVKHYIEEKTEEKAKPFLPVYQGPGESDSWEKTAKKSFETTISTVQCVCG